MSRKLGQHFLINKFALERIAAALDLKDGETIIEIGAGHGELTDELRIKSYELRIIAIEKDKALVQYLQKKFIQDENIKIIEGDILKTLPSVIHNSLFKIQNYKVTGNIPYYITGRLLRILSELEFKPSAIILTIQKEVAERIVADPPEINLLAAAVKFWAEPKILFYLKSQDFNPPPKVDSAVIKLNLKPIAENKTEQENYYKLINIVFKQPRKTILNNLRRNPQIDKNELKKILNKLNINPSDRPQDLSIKQLKELSNFIH